MGDKIRKIFPLKSNVIDNETAQINADKTIAPSCSIAINFALVSSERSRFFQLTHVSFEYKRK